MIFGSTAIKYWFTDFKRNPKDIDKMSLGKTSKEVEVEAKAEVGVGVEVEAVW